MKFKIELSFVDKPNEIEEVEAFDNRQALHLACAVHPKDKHNIIGARIIYMED